MGDSCERPQRRKTVYLSDRFQILFHKVGGEPHLSSKMTPLSENPIVYFIDDFLNESELLHLDTICQLYSNKFGKSFTENEMNEEVLSSYRTSEFIYLTKSQDKFVRQIEKRAADLVMLRCENVEPIQIVSYRDGQHFDIHHDAGTLSEEGDSVEAVQPLRLVTLFVVGLLITIM